MQNIQEASIEEEITLLFFYFFYGLSLLLLLLFYILNSKFTQRVERVTYLPSMFQKYIYIYKASIERPCVCVEQRKDFSTDFHNHSQ